MLLSFCGYLAVLLAVLGGMAFLKRLTKLNAGLFAPILLTAALSVTFLCGLCGGLQVGVWVLYGLGWASLLFFAVAALLKKFSFSFLRQPAVYVFFGFSFLAFFLLYTAKFYHFDNFSHWAVVWSEICEFNKFPDASTLVNFRDYICGSAGFLYGFCQLVGRTEGAALIGQSMLGIACLSTLFVRVKTVKSWKFFSALALFVAVFSLLAYDDGTLHSYNLLVDALIGFFSVAAFMIFTEGKKDSFFQAELGVFPVLCALVALKSAAMIFVLLTVGLMAACAVVHRRTLGAKEWIALPLVSFLPYLFKWFWNRYLLVAYGGESVTTYKFEGFAKAIEAHKDVYREIFSQTFRKVIDFSSAYCFVFYAAVLLAVFCFPNLEKKEHQKRFLRRGGYALTVVLVYFLSIMFNYCFLMPADEASYLAAYERYIVTALIVFVAVVGDSLALVAEDAFPDSSFFRRRFYPFVFGAVICLCVFGNVKQVLIRPNFAESNRGKVYPAQSYAAQVLDRNESVAMYNGHRWNRNFYYYTMYYQLQSRACFDLDMEETNQWGLEVDVRDLYRYDWLVIGCLDDELREQLKAVDYSFTEKEGCLLYRIDTSGDLDHPTVVITPYEGD